MAKRSTKRKTETVQSDAAEGSLVSHLIELRGRLIKAILGVMLVFAALAPFSNKTYVLLARPLMAVLPQGGAMIATDLVSPFLTPLKLTLTLAVVLSVPWILYQFWAFVAPGLYKNEKRLALPLLASSVLLFYAGMAFAYFLVFPVAFHFLTATAPAGVTVMTDIRAYLNFVFTLFFAFGVAFEVPVATVLFVKLGFVRATTLSQKRPYVVLAVFIVAAFLTPPDVFSQFLLAIPMWFLFEIGLFFAHRLDRSEAPAASSRALTEAQMEAQLDDVTNDKRDKRD